MTNPSVAQTSSKQTKPLAPCASVRLLARNSVGLSYGTLLYGDCFLSSAPAQFCATLLDDCGLIGLVVRIKYVPPTPVLLDSTNSLFCSLPAPSAHCSAHGSPVVRGMRVAWTAYCVTALATLQNAHFSLFIHCMYGFRLLSLLFVLVFQLLVSSRIHSASIRFAFSPFWPLEPCPSY